MPEIKKILIVEDESVIALSLRIILTKAGYTVAGIFARGEQALEEALQNIPDLVLMDIRLAGVMDGIDTAREIILRTSAPVLFMTAYTDPEVQQRAMDVKPLGFLTKPVILSDIETCIRSLCE